MNLDLAITNQIFTMTRGFNPYEKRSNDAVKRIRTYNPMLPHISRILLLYVCEGCSLSSVFLGKGARQLNLLETYSKQQNKQQGKVT